MIKLKENAAKYIRENPLSSTDEKYVIKLSFEHLKDVIKSIKIDLAPEIKDIADAVKSMEHISKHIYDTSNVSKSKYSGQIKMGLQDRLCKNCDGKKR